MERSHFNTQLHAILKQIYYNFWHFTHCYLINLLMDTSQDLCLYLYKNQGEKYDSLDF